MNPRLGVGGGSVGTLLVVHVRSPLDDVTAAQVPALVGSLRPHDDLVVDLRACDFVDVRGFRALVGLQDRVHALGGRMSVLDPPRTLRVICGAAPGLLALVPGETGRGPLGGGTRAGPRAVVGGR